MFDVLDADGKKTGVVRERSLVHMDGVPHRTAHIWVVRKNEDKTYDLLLQKRSRERIPIRAVMTFPQQAMCRPVMNSCRPPSGN